MTEYVVTLRIAGNSTGAKDALKVVDTELKQVQGQLKETEAQSQKTAAGFSKAGVAIGTAIAATAVAMTTLIAKSITMADETGKTAARFGASAEALSGWRAAAEMAGASSTALDAGLKGLSISITAAAGGQKKFSQVFEDMGIAVKGASGEVRDLESLLPEIASKFQEYKNGPAEAALATKIFGAAGVELLPFLNEGADGIDKLRARAEELGMVLSTKTTKDAADFKDNLGELKMAGIGLFNAIAKDVLPILRDLSAMFVDSGVDALGAAKKTSYIAEALKFVAGAAIIAKNALEMLANIMSGVLSAAYTKVKSGFESVK